MSNSLTKYNKYSPVWLDSDSVFSQMENFFQEAFSPFLTDVGSSLSLFEKSAYPRLDIREEPDKIVVDVETPGLSKEDVKVEVDNDVLIIRGEKRNELTEEKKGKYLRKELKRSSFSRQVCTLNDNCDTDKIDASFKDGLLTITIPKKVVDKPKIAPKSIAVK
jgi:HSP20 family protein